MMGIRCFEKLCVHNNEKEERCRVPVRNTAMDHSGRCLNRKLSDPLG